MRLTVVGCSGSIPGPRNPASCYLLEADGFRLVVDMGSGALGALQQYTGLDEVDAVCLSHLHADHFIDMCSFWVARTYWRDGALPRIPVYGPAATARRVASANDDPDVTGAFEFVTLAPGRWRIGPFDVTAGRVAHPVETFAFRFEHGGRVLTYSGDTGPSPVLTELPDPPMSCCARRAFPTSRAFRRTCTSPAGRRGSMRPRPVPSGWFSPIWTLITIRPAASPRRRAPSVGLPPWRPTTRIYDIANAPWYWAPLRDPRDRSPALADADIPHRVAVFADAYGMTAQQRAGLVPLAVDMVRHYHEDSRVSAELDPVYRKLWENGAMVYLPRAEVWVGARDGSGDHREAHPVNLGRKIDGLGACIG